MASPRSISTKSLPSAERRYRRSSFNGAKQLSAAQAPNRRMVVLLAVLALALVAALAVIVGVQVQQASEQTSPAATSATHQASH